MRLHTHRGVFCLLSCIYVCMEEDVFTCHDHGAFTVLVPLESVAVDFFLKCVRLGFGFFKKGNYEVLVQGKQLQECSASIRINPGE